MPDSTTGAAWWRRCAQTQVWVGGEQPGLVAAVPGDRGVERAAKLRVGILDRLWAYMLYFLQRKISTEPL